MFSYRIEGPVLHITAAGSYSVEDIRRTCEVAAKDARLPPRALLLLDLRDSASTLNLGDLSERVKLLGPIIPKIAPFRAIVAADPYRRHFSRHVQLTTSESFAIHVAIFDTPEEARAWLLAWPASFSLADVWVRRVPGKRRYRVLRVPQSVAERLYRRASAGPC
jgi:hypothetical protein